MRSRTGSLVAAAQAAAVASVGRDVRSRISARFARGLGGGGNLRLGGWRASRDLRASVSGGARRRDPAVSPVVGNPLGVLRRPGYRAADGLGRYRGVGGR